MSDLDARLRRHFPIYADAPHDFHYLDNAATAQICDEAADALVTFETKARANVKRGVYKLADQASAAFDEARRTMAAYLGIDEPREIAFTSGCTAALNTIANGLAPRLGPGDEIVVSELEHHSNIVPWHLVAERTGARVRALPVTEDGRLDLSALPGILNDRTRIVAVTHVSNVTGAITDLKAISSAAREIGALVVVDAAQRAAHGPIDVPSTGADFYALSGHKMFGATGAGLFWGRMSLLEQMPPLLGGGEMIREVRIDSSSFADPPHRFEAGTPPIGSVLAMAAAARFLMRQNWDDLGRHELAVTERLLAGLTDIEDVELIGPTGMQQRYGVVSFEVPSVHAHDVCQMLDTFGVAVRGGHHCTQPLMNRFDRIATVRASLAPYNDGADIDALLTGLKATIERLG